MSNDTFRIDHTLCKSETTQLPKQNHSLAIAPTTQTLVRRPQLLTKPQILCAQQKSPQTPALSNTQPEGFSYKLILLRTRSALY